jgi:hypothetical protein
MLFQNGVKILNILPKGKNINLMMYFYTPPLLTLSEFQTISSAHCSAPAPSNCVSARDPISYSDRKAYTSGFMMDRRRIGEQGLNSPRLCHKLKN